MTYSYIAYIDEAGDDGLQKLKDSAGNNGSTHWLILGAIIARSSNDANMVGYRDSIKKSAQIKSNKRDIHFKDLKHEQKTVVAQVISELPIRSIVVASNKQTILNHPRKDLYNNKNDLYWYLAKYLIERISQCCYDLRSKVSEGNGKVKIIFSTRGGLVYQDFKDYLQKIKDGNTNHPETNYIKWDVIDIELVENIDHSRNAGLQIADCVVSSFFSALEKGRYGIYETRYALQLKKIIYKDQSGNYINKGLSPVPSINNIALKRLIDTEQSSFFDKFKKGGAP